MNYFGHAAIASERRADVGFVLGAMLPDLVGMLRVGCPETEDDTVHAGLAFHRTTDAVFHACPTFLALNRAASSELRRVEIARGPARAIAHLATEMLIDAVLIRNPDYERSYLQALQQAPQVSSVLDWKRAEEAAHFVGLATHLLERGPAVHAEDPEHIVFRLGRALSGRPRVEPSVQELERVLAWLPGHTEQVHRRTADLLLEVRQGLALSPRLQTR